MKHLILAFFLSISVYIFSNDLSSDVKFRGSISGTFIEQMGKNPTIYPVSDFASYGCVDVSYGITVPFLTKVSPLLGLNNLSLTSQIEVSPVYFKGGFVFGITPIAFLNFTAGMTIGTGWNFWGIDCLARYNNGGEYPNEPKGVLDKDSGYGPVMENWLTSTFQVDFAYVVPAKYFRWTHVIVQSNATFLNTTFLNNAYYDKPYVWIVELKQNGWEFDSDSYLGYQIPIIDDKRKKEAENKMFMNFVNHNYFAITTLLNINTSTSLTHYNDSKMSDKGWGSDFTNIRFGLLNVFDLPCNFRVVLGFYGNTKRIFTEDFTSSDDFYSAQYKGWGIIFERILVNVGWSF